MRIVYPDIELRTHAYFFNFPDKPADALTGAFGKEHGILEKAARYVDGLLRDEKTERTIRDTLHGSQDFVMVRSRFGHKRVDAYRLEVLGSGDNGLIERISFNDGTYNPTRYDTEVGLAVQLKVLASEIEARSKRSDKPKTMPTARELNLSGQWMFKDGKMAPFDEDRYWY